MANTKSARKRIRTNERRRVPNVMVRSELKTLLKKSVQSTAGKTENSQDSLAAAIHAQIIQPQHGRRCS